MIYIIYNIYVSGTAQVRTQSANFVGAVLSRRQTRASNIVTFFPFCKGAVRTVWLVSLVMASTTTTSLA